MIRLKVFPIRRYSIFALAFSVITPIATFIHSASANTDSWWAWPGQEFVMYEQGWHSCSVGYPAWDKDGNHYFITAGHCFRDPAGKHYLKDVAHNVGIDVYSPNNTTDPVGWEKYYTLITKDGHYIDASLVQMYTGKRLDDAGWRSIPNKPHQAARGEHACLVGWRNNHVRCGSISMTNALGSMRGYEWPQKFDKATYCGLPGDSGGAVFNENGALGINSSYFPGTCEAGFTPIDIILEALRSLVPTLTIE